MKTFFYSIVISVFLFSCVNSNEKKDQVSVNGNCGMCKATIEKSLDLHGVYSANWDKKTKILDVSYDSTLITIDKITKNIAAVGYDSELHTASDSAYNSLHGCCQYVRD